MDGKWSVYVGADVPASAASAGGSSTQELLDTAFARRAEFTLRTTPPAVRRRPSAAPSPVLRWLLLMENTQKAKTTSTAEGSSASPSGMAKANSHASPNKEARPSATPPVQEAGHAPTPPPAPALATAALARRGVGPKDPLLQRLIKRHKPQHQPHAEAAAAPTQSAATTTSETAATTKGSSANASHWTQHPYSAMTATSWRVFRQQLGITVELIAPAATVAPAKPPFAASTAFVSSAALPAANTLPAIRCWEEAQLPLSLGRCVTAHYALPTAVQAQCVPLALMASPAAVSAAPGAATGQPKATPTAAARTLGIDVLAVAETGSGKTAAYVVPLLNHVLCRAPKLLGHPDRISLGPMALVMVPTRELAEQVTASLLQLCGQVGPTASSPSASPAAAPATGVRQADIAAWEVEECGQPAGVPERNFLSEFRVVKVVGGESRDAQYAALAQGAHCVVGTVGQLQTLLEDRMLSLGNTQFVVVDEADRMIDEQQEAKLVAVLERCPTPRQTLMFTATLSAACASMAKRYLSKSGYYLVRTPYRCASIRQSFELISTTAATTTTTTTTTGTVADLVGHAERSPQPPRQQRKLEGTNGSSAGEHKQRQRGLHHALIHPQKFARLIPWLVYSTGPVIVFANEKATCDALFDELRTEAEHLDAQQEYFALTDLVGPPPDGLIFREGNEVPSPSSHATAVAASRSPSLSNLTSVAVVHSDLSQSERRSLVAQFQRRQRQVLITTDLLARGLDVTGVTLVINYDVPWSATGVAADAVALYIHRIGRTGRAGSTGVAVSFVALPAATVQRAEEVVQAEALPSKSASLSAARARAGGWASAAAADDDNDPMSLVGELFDGDTRSVWVAGAGVGRDESGGRGRQNDASENEGETRMSDNEEEGPEKGREQARRKRAKPQEDFASDASFLRPLWSFLVECAEGEGVKDGAAALRRGTYVKISVPPALALIMAQLSATSQFGRITL
ncbi:putative ATP-dependent RNA helicase [Leptomonas seymouri]|uniref:Putative ATP-dependent RNA helicase n=1 Tax=Leptomonas seymouri TaxID=5684 RepID=A0A0N1I0W3_LEPSE|nr:putative ATP-dependent RNA helicase [Leptomonas seymouri]|eukprot:KPI83702.1 putative ATP-dependent RNA helicase [Leptomonas seymouri]